MYLTRLSALTVVFLACGEDDPRDPIEVDTTEASEVGETTETLEPDGTPDGDTADSADTRPEVDAGPFVWPWPLEAIAVAPHASWKAEVTFPEDPFLAQQVSFDPPSPRWVKFTVLTGDPTRVFFQDSLTLPLHYTFGSAHLPPLDGLDHAAFDQATLYNEGRKAILGAVLFAPFRWGSGAVADEIGIQLASRDALDPQVVTTVLDLVKAAVVPQTSGVTLDAFYMPTFEQSDTAKLSAAYFAEQGFPLGTAERWSEGDTCYVPGWSIGRLVEVAPDQIDAAWQAGTLTPNDILVIDQVPAELPPVAGIVTRSPSSPASHVAILATTFEIPFVFAATDEARAAIDAHLGQVVALRATNDRQLGSAAQCHVVVVAGDAIPAADRDALLASKAPTPIAFAPRVSPGVLSAAAASLDRGDVASYGGKAANFAVLRAAIPEASPDPAIAFSFDLFDRLMARPSGDTTLGAAIAARLGHYTWPPDMAALATDLEAVRDLVKASSFAPEDVSAIKTALAPFTPERNIRFRSSTNVEDTTTFTGAGLYDSYSGCLADDDDADGVGPSICDPSETDERGVVRAMLKVYASFWNDNAFLARLEHGVDPAKVAMGLLVHHSYPDDEELANGVAIVHDAGSSRHHTLTTQLGAVSVTNPEGSAQPEIISADIYGFGTFFTPIQSSSLVPLGSYVMAWEADYQALSALLERVADEWGKALGDAAEYQLDFEYKLAQRPGQSAKLEVKQVRPLPLVDRTTETTAYLLPGDRPTRLCTFQGESGSLYGIHRNKLILALTHRPTFLDAAAQEAGVYTHIDVQFVDAHLEGAPASLPGAFHVVPEKGEWSWTPRIDGFVRTGPSAFAYSINSSLPWSVSAADAPLVKIEQGYFSVGVEYGTPQYDPDYWDGDNVTSDAVTLGACPDETVITPSHPRRRHTASAGAVSVDIGMWYPPMPTGVVAGYTAPLAKWDVTTISGLTTTPIELRGYWSQSFRPGHHNFEEFFLFEPALEAGIDPALVAELAAKDIRFIWVRVGDGGQVKVAGPDGRLREL